MKKMRRVFWVVAAAAMLATPLWAQEEAHGREVSVIVAEIKAEQDVKRLSEINPDAVDPKLLEELGDAVMALTIADEEQHRWMDRMMGGEGSEQLSSAHRWIGYNYLRNDGTTSQWGPGMMGYGGLMGPGMMWGHGWGRGWNSGWNPTGRMVPWANPWMNPWVWGFGIVLLGAVIAVVVALIRRRRFGHTGGGSSRSMDILRARYARGEISRDEFQKIREDLR